MRGKRILRWIAAVLALLLLLTCVELFRSNCRITVSGCELRSEKIAEPIRIVFLSDLHGLEFGPGNEGLLNKIAAQGPDLIMLGGDIFNSDADTVEIDSMCGFIRACAELAPTYFGMGNHEYFYLQNDKAGLRGRITEAGAVIVDNDQCDIEFKGSAFRIGGYMGYYPYPHMTTDDPEQIALEKAFLKDFRDTDRFTILLNHIPTGWLDWNYYNKDAVDLVLCGHYHGGVIRIPILEQGLYAPYVGKFPPFTKGVFVGKAATCVLTAGLAGSYGLPRFFNPPEICVVDLLPAA